MYDPSSDAKGKRVIHFSSEPYCFINTRINFVTKFRLFVDTIAKNSIQRPSVKLSNISVYYRIRFILIPTLPMSLMIKASNQQLDLELDRWAIPD